MVPAGVMVSTEDFWHPVPPQVLGLAISKMLLPPPQVHSVHQHMAERACRGVVLRGSILIIANSFLPQNAVSPLQAHSTNGRDGLQRGRSR